MAIPAGLLPALDALFGSASADARRAAEAWLLSFQQGDAAWQASLALLATPSTPPHARAFAAQTVRAKARRQLGSVSEADAPGLRDALVRALAAEAAGPPSPVLGLLAAAVADLALAWDAWTEPVRDVLGALGGAPPGAVATFLAAVAEAGAAPPRARVGHGAPAPPARPSTAGSLPATPGGADGVHGEDATAARDRACAWAGVALPALAGGPPSTDALRAFGAWARLGALADDHGPAAFDAAVSLIHACAAAAAGGEPAAASAGAGALEDCVDGAHPDAYGPSLAAAARPLAGAAVAAATAGRPDAAEAAARPYAALASAAPDLVFADDARAWGDDEPPAPGAAADAAAWRAGLLACATLPGCDAADLASLPASGDPPSASALDAWAHLAEAADAAGVGGGCGGTPGPTVAAFSSLLAALLPALASSHARAEADGLFEEEEAEEDEAGGESAAATPPAWPPLARAAADALAGAARLVGPASFLSSLTSLAGQTSTPGALAAALSSLTAAEEVVGEAVGGGCGEAAAADTADAALALLSTAAAAGVAGGGPPAARPARLQVAFLTALSGLAPTLTHHLAGRSDDGGRGAAGFVSHVLAAASPVLASPAAPPSASSAAAAAVRAVVDAAAAARVALPPGADAQLAAAAVAAAGRAAPGGGLSPLAAALATAAASAAACPGGGPGAVLAALTAPLATSPPARSAVGLLGCALAVGGSWAGQGCGGGGGGSGPGPHPASVACAAVAAFGQHWPALRDVIASPAADPALRADAARLVGGAARAHAGAAAAAAPDGSAVLAAAAASGPPGLLAAAAPILGAALVDAAPGGPASAWRPGLLAALSTLGAGPAWAAALSPSGAATDPDATAAALALIGSAAGEAGTPGTPDPPPLTGGPAVAAAAGCAASPHRGVSSAALGALASLFTSAASAAGPGSAFAAQAVAAGPTAAAGVVAALLAPAAGAPAARVAKAAAALAALAAAGARLAPEGTAQAWFQAGATAVGHPSPALAPALDAADRAWREVVCLASGWAAADGDGGGGGGGALPPPPPLPPAGLPPPPPMHQTEGSVVEELLVSSAGRALRRALRGVADSG